MQVSVSSSSSNVIDTQTAVKVFSGESSKIETKMASKSGSNSSAMRYPWQSKDKINLDTRQLSSQMKEFEDEVIKKMIEISSHPSLLHTFKFGKHNGKRIEDVIKVDRGYLQWLLDQKLNGDGIDEDWIYTLKHYLDK